MELIDWIIVICVILFVIYCFVISLGKRKKRREHVTQKDKKDTNNIISIISNLPITIEEQNETEKELSQNEIDDIIYQFALSEIDFYYGDDIHYSIFDVDIMTFKEVARLIVIHQQASTSLIQRKFSIGYGRAGYIMDRLASVGIVGTTQGAKPRKVFIQDEMQLERLLDEYNKKYSFLFNESAKSKFREKYAFEIEGKRKEIKSKIEFERKE